MKTPVTVNFKCLSSTKLYINDLWLQCGEWGTFSRKTNNSCWKYKWICCKKKPLVAFAETYRVYFSLSSELREHFWKNQSCFSFTQSVIYTCTPPTPRYRHYSAKLRRAAAWKWSLMGNKAFIGCLTRVNDKKSTSSPLATHQNQERYNCWTCTGFFFFFKHRERLWVINLFLCPKYRFCSAIHVNFHAHHSQEWVCSTRILLCSHSRESCWKAAFCSVI